ncbi:4915_t:CDS:1, partial [Racocetra fulgida]
NKKTDLLDFEDDNESDHNAQIKDEEQEDSQFKKRKRNVKIVTNKRKKSVKKNK